MMTEQEVRCAGLKTKVEEESKVAKTENQFNQIKPNRTVYTIWFNRSNDIVYSIWFNQNQIGPIQSHIFTGPSCLTTSFR